MSNQDLIDQLEADKVRLGDLITATEAQIDQNISTIASYTNYIADLATTNTALEAQITDYETQIANDDLIIALIPPDA